MTSASPSCLFLFESIRSLIRSLKPMRCLHLCVCRESKLGERRMSSVISNHTKRFVRHALREREV